MGRNVNFWCNFTIRNGFVRERKRKTSKDVERKRQRKGREWWDSVTGTRLSSSLFTPFWFRTIEGPSIFSLLIRPPSKWTVCARPHSYNGLGTIYIFCPFRPKWFSIFIKKKKSLIESLLLKDSGNKIRRNLPSPSVDLRFIKILPTVHCLSSFSLSLFICF